MKYIKILFLVSFIIQIFVSSSCSNREPYREELEVFKNTEIWDLAKELKHDDIDDFTKLVNSKKYNLNFQDPVHGNTLIHMCIYYNRYEFLEVLLKNNANPNVYDYLGMPPIVLVSNTYSFWDSPKYQDDLIFKYIKLLVKYGASCNDESKLIVPKYSLKYSVLMGICNRDTEDSFNKDLFEFVIQNGANINGSDSTDNPITVCIAHKNYKALFYLLNIGADFNRVYKIFPSDGKKTKIKELLKGYYFKLDSKEYFLKKAVIDFINSKDNNSEKIIILPKILNKIKRDYPNNWEEVSKVY